MSLTFFEACKGSSQSLRNNPTFPTVNVKVPSVVLADPILMSLSGHVDCVLGDSFKRVRVYACETFFLAWHSLVAYPLVVGRWFGHGRSGDEQDLDAQLGPL